MGMNLDTVFGIHETALKLRGKRSELLAQNLANADTPNYKARDIDFRQVLQQFDNHAKSTKAALANTQGEHAQSANFNPLVNIKYRVPMQPSLDGNTVDLQTEQAAFTENSLRYQASLNFIEGTMTSLRSALSEVR